MNDPRYVDPRCEAVLQFDLLRRLARCQFRAGHAGMHAYDSASESDLTGYPLSHPDERCDPAVVMRWGTQEDLDAELQQRFEEHAAGTTAG